MTQLILIRHGQTEWNRVERFRGRAELDLNETGIKQAELVASRLTQWRVSAIYSSPLRRATATSQILAQRLNLKVNMSSALIDIDYGDWQGLSPQEAQVRDSSLYTMWLDRPHLVKFPGGESLADVRERVILGVNNLVAQHPEEIITLVSHKVVCQVLILGFLDLDNSHFWQITQDVSAINLFEVKDGVPTSLLINDTCHLKGLTALSQALKQV